jgi:signal transduction histidine kinase
MTSRSAPLYRWWPRYSRGSVELGGAGPQVLARTGFGLLAVAAVLCLPPVTAATTLSAPRILLIFSLYFACMVFNDYVLYPAAQRSVAGFNTQLVITPLYNVGFLTLLVVWPGDPKTPMWMGLLLYACTTAAWQQIDASIALLSLHTLAPLLTIPYFLSSGAHHGWAIGGPALCAVVSAVAYHIGAGVNVAWRALRSEQALAIESLRARNAQLERQHIAQDLHDAVGSSLSIFGLSADLVEHHAEQPDELRVIAGNLREASREGLSELRGMLDSMAPEQTTFGELGSAVRRAAARIRDVSGKPVDVSVAGDAATSVEGAVRLATMRIFQESVNNALRHARAAHVEVSLRIERNELLMNTVNDGATFARGDAAGPGRGVAGMRARAMQLGGSFDISSLPDGRTDVKVALPLSTVGER